MKQLRMMLLVVTVVAGTSVLGSAQIWRGNNGTWGGNPPVYRNSGQVYGNNGQVYGNNGQVYGGQYGDQRNTKAYQQGWKDGQDDAKHNRTSSTRVDKYNNDRDRAAWQQGYHDGYQSYANGGVAGNNGRGRGWGRGGRWGDHDRDHDRNGDANGRYPNGYPSGGYPNGGYGNGYPNNGGYGNGSYGNSGVQVAHQMGFQDGVREGGTDRQNNKDFRPTKDTGYKLATNGYRAEFGTKDQYRQWYREAYSRGYQQGYYGNNRSYGGGYPGRSE